MRSVALGRKNYLFLGSDNGGRSAAIACTLIETAKLDGVDPRSWLTDILSRIAATLRDDLEVDYIAPVHCTGKLAFAILKKNFTDRYLYSSLETTLMLSKNMMVKAEAGNQEPMQWKGRMFATIEEQ